MVISYDIVVLGVRKLGVALALAMVSALIAIAVSISPVRAQETLIWEEDVLSTGEPVSSPVLEAGREYRIEAKGYWCSWSFETGLIEFAADAQYYTPTPWSPGYNYWIWETTNTFPAPGGHSFLQINGLDVNWGPFSNGDSLGQGHEYTIYYTGAGAPVTFTIVDWIDGDSYDNSCHIHVKMYEGPSPPPEGETAYAYGGDYATCFRHWGFKNGVGPTVRSNLTITNSTSTLEPQSATSTREL